MSRPGTGHSISVEDNFLVCNIHDGFCRDIREFIELGADAAFFGPGMTMNVPVIPVNGIFATVHIDPVVYGVSSLMELQYTPDIGKPYSVNLGFWSPGEGCASIRSVITDYLKSKLDPRENLARPGLITRCPNPGHNPKASVIIERESQDSIWRWQCVWNMVMEKACTPCIAETSGIPDDNHGLDPDDNRPPWAF